MAESNEATRVASQAIDDVVAGHFDRVQAEIVVAAIDDLQQGPVDALADRARLAVQAVKLEAMIGGIDEGMDRLQRKLCPELDLATRPDEAGFQFGQITPEAVFWFHANNKVQNPNRNRLRKELMPGDANLDIGLFDYGRVPSELQKKVVISCNAQNRLLGLNDEFDGNILLYAFGLFHDLVHLIQSAHLEQVLSRDEYVHLLTLQRQLINMEGEAYSLQLQALNRFLDGTLKERIINPGLHENSTIEFVPEFEGRVENNLEVAATSKCLEVGYVLWGRQ